MTAPARARPGRAALLWLLAAALCYAATIPAQRAADRLRPPLRDEVLYLPNEKLLTHFTAGLAPVIADLLWLRCVQYTALENRGARSFTWLEQMIFTTTRLDPRFKGVYRYGAIFLSALRADSEAAMRLLRTGMVEVPDAWELPYEAAIIQLVNRRGAPDAERLTAFYCGMAVATGRPPAFVAELASRFQAKQDLSGIEEGMWRRMLESDDKVMRELAARKLQEMAILRNLHTMEKWVEEYRARHGAPPDTLEALLAFKGAKALPPDPLGGRYFLGPEAKPMNSTMLDTETARELGMLRRRVEEFRNTRGAFPGSLEELARETGMKRVPEHPWPGRSWKYDPATGTVE
ncbi:MAG TPA: hypothetical protein P5069_15345 [Candidatus Hydrogenedentes bacterium]|nr:hypothetical protein [Candidatus Hydrogenedentota bacterium]HOC71794.1 hypothetical protein [Candidatus Hydrogenedentota bacterium]HQL93995.1 hypothetical protein [Candidatus Hydrogenedentota bacterium]HRZ83824.1 hypothetical protein [Candidatus Hydrogenedentota bacterium]